MIWKCLDKTFDLSLRGEIMGIVNVTPDSFTDGGLYETTESALSLGRRLVSEGATIIDIGGESTRPGASDVSIDEELRRVLPVIEILSSTHPEVAISTDTSKAAVAAAAIESGARIINDVTGFRDPAMIDVAAATGVGIVVMHMQGTPRTMQAEPAYADVVAEIREFFADQHETLTAAGIAPEAIVYDPGIGFGKTLEHNLELLHHLDEITVAERPILLGVSRKSFLGKLISSEKIEDRVWPTVALTSQARELGVPLHRVHDVRENVQALRMTEAILARRHESNPRKR